MKLPRDKAKYAYLAGMIDGDGYFSITKTLIKDRNSKPYPAFDLQVGVSGTSERLMKWLVSVFGQSYFTLAHRTNTFAKRPCYQWKIANRKQQEILILAILPYLVIKKQQANTALQYIRLPHNSPTERMALHYRMIALNDKYHQKSESPTTNTSSASPNDVKIESGLVGNYESASVVTQTA